MKISSLLLRASLPAMMLLALPARAAGTSTEVRAKPADVPPAPVAAAQTTTAPAPLAAVVRGAYLGVRMSGGYMVLGANIKNPPNANISGKEKYGVGTMLQFELGYDLTPTVALELLGGQSFVSGTRSDWVRDLSVTYGGLGVRLAPSLKGERLRFVVMGGVGYASANNAVEKAEAGVAAFANFGLEYYVHVRHFSVGIDASVMAPLQPLRMLVTVGPQLKYSF